jgi:hypothetical protein
LQSHLIIDILFRGNKMAAKIKPVESTVIKDKKIVREVIASGTPETDCRRPKMGQRTP